MHARRTTGARVVLASALLTAGLGAVAGSPAAATPNPGCCDVLRGVDATSATDAWAVGEWKQGTTLRTLALHWDGATWRQVTTPNVGSADNSLSRVVALARNDAWAVGAYGSTGLTRNLVMHWDGRTWRVVSSPNVGTRSNFLSDVDGRAANDVWAVGRTDSGPSQVSRTLVLHWDGRTWKVVTSPNAGTGQNELSGVAVVGTRDVWAVGGRYDGARFRTLSMHWDGSTWRLVTTPTVGTRSNFLFGGVAATSATDAWAVGGYDAGGVFKPLILHWNGRTWSVTPSPAGSTRGGTLYGGVTATSSTDAWAVGYSGWGKTFVQHWDGRSWRVVSSANVGTRSNELTDVVALSPSLAWTVGTYFTGTTQRTLVERWNGATWSVQ